MSDDDSMLDRHVAFELARWRGEHLASSLREDVDALFAWLGSVAVVDLGRAEEVARAAAAVVDDQPLTDETLALAAEVLAVGHEALLECDDLVADVVRRSDFDALAQVLSRADRVRDEVLQIVTTSEAYSRLVAHVLYNGVKSYLLTENVLARKIPGASSLVRLGQRGLNSAAPGLEAGLDRQLTGFVRTNIAETLRDSRRFLEGVLDEEMLQAMAADAWDRLSDRPLSSLAGAADPADTREVVDGAGRLVRSFRDSGILSQLVAAAVSTMLERHGERRVGEVLQDCGITAQRVAADLALILSPILDRADADGFLEERIRARLEPFYSSLPPTPAD